jgi:DNA-binding transcriptional ArsR family regulator
MLPLTQSTASERLKRLREAGLVRGEIDGPAVCYGIDEEKLDWVKREIAALKRPAVRTRTPGWWLGCRKRPAPCRGKTLWAMLSI